MIMWCLSIYLILFQFLSIKFCSFLCTYLLLWFLENISFDVIVNEIFKISFSYCLLLVQICNWFLCTDLVTSCLASCLFSSNNYFLMFKLSQIWQVGSSSSCSCFFLMRLHQCLNTYLIVGTRFHSVISTLPSKTWN